MPLACKALCNKAIRCSSVVFTAKRPRPPGNVEGILSMPYKRNTSSYKSISRSKSGRKLGETTSSTSSLEVAETLHPKSSRVCHAKSREISSPIMRWKRLTRKMFWNGSLFFCHTSIIPWSFKRACITCPPATSTIKAAAAAERSSMSWSSTPRS